MHSNEVTAGLVGKTSKQCKSKDPFLVKESQTSTFLETFFLISTQKVIDAIESLIENITNWKMSV